MSQRSSGATASPARRFFNPAKQKQPGQAQKRADREKRSKSSSYRNRSLKQLFGDIPAISEYSSAQLACTPRQVGKAKAIAPGTHNAASRESAGDEYLIKHRERLKDSKRQDPVGMQKPEDDKRKLITQRAGDSTGSSQRAQTGSAFYDPNAYSWRKTPSKQKHLLKMQQNKKDGLPSKISGLPKTPEMMQSEYYGTPRHSQLAVDARKAAEELREQRLRSSSIEFLKRDKPARLKPRVSKHIFELKSPRQKHHSMSAKKNLLFTFGIRKKE